MSVRDLAVVAAPSDELFSKAGINMDDFFLTQTVIGFTTRVWLVWG
jgi:hypothetical protein